jgi:hypothetical protein
MTSSSSSVSLGQTISKKLTHDNFLLWKAQAVPVVRGAQLYGYLDGTIKESSSLIIAVKDGQSEQVPKPTHAAWIVQDQQVLEFLNASLS